MGETLTRPPAGKRIREYLRTVVWWVADHPSLCWWGGATIAIILYFCNGSITASYDQLCHGVRLDQISDGVIVPSAGDFDFTLAGNRYFCGNTAVNSPLAYMLAVIPWALAKPFHMQYGAALLANGVIGTGLCALSMALAGRNKWFIMAVCSMPVTMLSLAWVGADTMAITTTMIMLGCMLGLLDEQSWARQHVNAVFVIMLLDSVLLGNMKSSLCAVAFLPLVLTKLLGGKIWGWGKAIAIFVAQALSQAIWMFSVRGITPVTCGPTEDYSYCDHGYALRWYQFFSDPLGAAHSLLVTLFGWVHGKDSFIRVSAEWQLITGVGGFTDNGSRTFTVILALAGLVPLVVVGFLHATGWFAQETGLRVPRWTKFVFSAWCVGFVALTMFMVLMVYGRAVYGGQIIGLQGRYFVYMIPIALLCLPQAKWIKIDDSKTSYQHGSAIMLAASLAALTTIVIPGLIV